MFFKPLQGPDACGELGVAWKCQTPRNTTHSTQKFRQLANTCSFKAATYAHRAGRCGRMGTLFEFGVAFRCPQLCLSGYNGIVISLASGGYCNKRLGRFSDEFRSVFAESFVQLTKRHQAPKLCPTVGL